MPARLRAMELTRGAAMQLGNGPKVKFDGRRAFPSKENMNGLLQRLQLWALAWAMIAAYNWRSEPRAGLESGEVF